MAKIRLNRQKEYKQLLRLLLTLSNSVRKDIRNLFYKYRDITSKEFIKNQDISSETFTRFQTELTKIFDRSTRRIMETMKDRIQKQRMQKQDDTIDPIITQYSSQFSAMNVSNITETTRASLKLEISRGLDTGQEINTIAKNIEKSVAFSLWRSTMIARTETHQAMNFGNQEIIKNLGLSRPIKEWASAVDERTRSWHKNMNLMQVDADKDFLVMTPVSGGGFVEKPMAYPGDMKGGASNVINCRCFTFNYDADDLVD
tara:strand:- start:2158 stop:2931 length:774 start_codon:yes stop_codon:yes gene_type:complete